MSNNNDNGNGSGGVSATRITMPLVWLILGGMALASWTWVVSTQFSGLRQEMQNNSVLSSKEIQSVKTDIQVQISRIEGRMDARDGRESDAMALAWAEFFLANPGLKRPERAR